MSSLILAIGLSSTLLAMEPNTEAPTIDDSIAILDEQQVGMEPPAANYDLVNADEELALAQDDETTTQKSNADLLAQLKSMQQEIQELRGLLEVQTHELNLLKKQQITLYDDLDRRLGNSPGLKLKTELSSEELVETKKIEAKSAVKLNQDQLAPEPKANILPTPVAKPMNNGSVRGNPADEQVSYLAAYDLVKRKQFDQALLAMQAFVEKYPQGGYTANAQYWLGELYLVNKAYPQAIKHFEIVLDFFPNSSKAAASSLKIGYALAASGKKLEAKQRLQEVIKNFPDTPTAELASAKLKSIHGL